MKLLDQSWEIDRELNDGGKFIMKRGFKDKLNFILLPVLLEGVASFYPCLIGMNIAFAEADREAKHLFTLNNI